MIRGRPCVSRGEEVRGRGLKSANVLDRGGMRGSINTEESE